MNEIAEENGQRELLILILDERIDSLDRAPTLKKAAGADIKASLASEDWIVEQGLDCRLVFSEQVRGSKLSCS